MANTSHHQTGHGTTATVGGGVSMTSTPFTARFAIDKSLAAKIRLTSKIEVPDDLANQIAHSIASELQVQIARDPERLLGINIVRDELEFKDFIEIKFSISPIRSIV